MKNKNTPTGASFHMRRAKQRNSAYVHIQQMASPSGLGMYARIGSINFDMHSPYYNIFIDFRTPPHLMQSSFRRFIASVAMGTECYVT